MSGAATRACCVLFLIPSASAASEASWSQTVPLSDGSYKLGAEMPPITLAPIAEPQTAYLKIDRSMTYQTLQGFGGAFTEASALNWRSLPAAEQAEVIKSYFASPEEGGLGYTLGRVPSES